MSVSTGHTGVSFDWSILHGWWENKPYVVPSKNTISPYVTLFWSQRIVGVTVDLTGLKSTTHVNLALTAFSSNWPSFGGRVMSTNQPCSFVTVFTDSKWIPFRYVEVIRNITFERATLLIACVLFVISFIISSVDNSFRTTTGVILVLASGLEVEK